MALLQRPSVGEAALGIMLSVRIAWGIYKPSDNYMLRVDLAEYFNSESIIILLLTIFCDLCQCGSGFPC